MKKTINFAPSQKSGYAYEATLAVDNDFAVSLHSDPRASVTLFVSTIEGKDGQLKNNSRCDDNGNFDQDYDFIVYPKFITICTNHPVTDAYIITKED